MKREVFDDLWDKADKEHSSQGNNSFTFKHHLFAVLDDELKEQQQPQLTIPKSIADKLDKFIKTDFESLGHEDWWIQENGLIEWFSKTPNCYIKDAYLAGKAIGVTLVKVVEG
ncbi:hypothetical protein AB6B24_11745 [Lactococcus sp. AK05]|uniref:hypothetical protein n=1 Tax=Lactococcus sp. AK05 TaxID=3239197 RepID=UPI0034DEBB4A